MATLSRPKAWDTSECGLVAVKACLNWLGWVGLKTCRIGPWTLSPRTSALRVGDGAGELWWKWLDAPWFLYWLELSARCYRHLV
jgi:hypothetical protein